MEDEARMATTDDALLSCVCLLETMAEWAQAEGHEVEHVMMSVMAKNGRKALAKSRQEEARCCSAIFPCMWQRHNGMDSVCPTCTAAAPHQ